ncbi:MAG TPA: hypothetical protein VGN86_00645 [Pyrinomonadaceae bacterium]|nr:hypothetical protein [Pyrinomonadaceae bacterium]
MRFRNGPSLLAALLLLIASFTFTPVRAQRPDSEDEREFGPVVRAYLGYLRNEQEVVDDRVSRREISRAYYRRNSNRIRALREIAMRIARESHNDYLPELEAVTANEFSTLFEHPPGIQNLVIGKVFNNTFRFVGSVRQVDVFYVFARLDPYEQAESKEKNTAASGANASPSASSPSGEPPTRPRRVRDP